ncbi:hypothetical protein DFH09DRAFT_1375126 [Mycena vulgaris]|nr:hypothetical protein DFH09DRAFT_1375126 [Mycena vulgaris]
MCAPRLTFNTTSSRADASTDCVASLCPSQLASQVATAIPDGDHVTRRYSARKLLLVTSYDDDDLPASPRHPALQRLPTPRRRSNPSTLQNYADISTARRSSTRCRLGLIIADKLGVLELLIAEEQPAFYQSYEYQRGQKLGVFHMNLWCPSGS